MISCIIEGEASGANSLAREWAKDRRVAVEPYPADWGNITRPGAVVKHNRAGKPYDAAAGAVRNERMLREGRPEHAIGFPGGSGTRDMAKKCWLYGIEPQLVDARRSS